MTKSKRNLLVSVLVLILTVAIAGGSTYAWFTTNVNVKVEEMQINVTTGSKGLYVSAYSNGTNYKTSLTLADLAATGTGGQSFDPAAIKLDNVTSANGKVMKEKGASASEVGKDSKKFVEFYAYFRATGFEELATPVVYLSKLRLTDNTQNKNAELINDAGVAFADLTTYGKASGSIAIGAPITAEAIHAARVSFETEAWTSGGAYPGTSTTIRVWDPYKENSATFCGKGTATSTVAATADWNTTVANNFALEYHERIADLGAGISYVPSTDTITLPNTEMGTMNAQDKDTAYDGSAATAANLFNSDVLKLAWNGTTKSHEGKLTVRIWLEGYDGDCVNAILNDGIISNMQFTIKQTV